MKRKWIGGVAVLIVAVFIIYQLVASLYNPISTEIVGQVTTTEGIDITGVIIREELPVRNTDSGTLHFEIGESEKVSNGGIIANIYASASQSAAASEIQSVAAQIANIEEIQKYNDYNAVDLELISNKIYESLGSIIRAAKTGDYSSAAAGKEDFLKAANRKQIATGEAVDFSKKLSELEARKTALEAQLGTPHSNVKAEKAGYFVSVFDGYESVLTPDNLSALTPEYLENLTPQKVNDGSVVGKIVSDYTWYIAAVVTLNESHQLKVGEQLKIATDLKSTPEINAVVHSVNMSPANDKAVVIFSCNQMNSELSLMRTGDMTVIKNVYTGLRVSSKALRFVNMPTPESDGTVSYENVTGVYVLTGMMAKFVPVNILYSGDSDKAYVICEEEKQSGKLKLYDEIIVEGKNIYDGKIID